MRVQETEGDQEIKNEGKAAAEAAIEQILTLTNELWVKRPWNEMEKDEREIF